MKIQIIPVIFITAILIGGCSSYKADSPSNECIDCQRLRDELKYFKDEEHAEKIILAEFRTAYGHEDGREMPWRDFEKIVLQSAGCCVCSPHPLAEEWMECDRLECIWGNIEKENVQKIAFSEFLGPDFRPPEDWHPWAVITEPEKINGVLKLLSEAMERQKDRFANEGMVVSDMEQMQIVTNKHKYIIPISFDKDVTYGIGWTTYKLMKKLTDWGLGKALPEEEDRILECVLENFEEENVRSISFCQYVLENKVDQHGHTYPSLECRPCGEITEPRRISEVLKLLREALRRGENKIEEGKTYDKIRMQVVTDKQKYFIRIFLDREAVHGIDWTSYELRKKLAEWGFLERK